jgi:TonB-dependent SusC/RagA subfamily outer membrane receptor
MEEQAGDLEAVVVTGYKTERKKDLNGAVSIVNMNDVIKYSGRQPNARFTRARSGVYVEAVWVAKWRQPQGSYQGFDYLGNTNPLYIIDGVPTNRPEVFRNLNPNSIASVQVLKDASAASIYGSRAPMGL